MTSRYGMADEIAGWYMLDENMKPRRCSIVEAADTRQAQKIVAQTDLGALGWLSTVFLGLDHSFRQWHQVDGVEHVPVLFETMLFNNQEELQDRAQWRDTTWPRAVARHRMVLRKLRRMEARYGGAVAADSVIRLDPHFWNRSW